MEKVLDKMIVSIGYCPSGQVNLRVRCIAFLQPEKTEVVGSRNSESNTASDILISIVKK